MPPIRLVHLRRALQFQAQHEWYRTSSGNSPEGGIVAKDMSPAPRTLKAGTPQCGLCNVFDRASGLAPSERFKGSHRAQEDVIAFDSRTPDSQVLQQPSPTSCGSGNWTSRFPFPETLMVAVWKQTSLKRRTATSPARSPRRVNNKRTARSRIPLGVDGQSVSIRRTSSEVSPCGRDWWDHLGGDSSACSSPARHRASTARYRRNIRTAARTIRIELRP